MPVTATLTSLRVLIAVCRQVTGVKDVPLDMGRICIETGLDAEAVKNCLGNTQLFINGLFFRGFENNEYVYRRTSRPMQITCLHEARDRKAGIENNIVYDLDQPAIFADVESCLIRAGLLAPATPAPTPGRKQAAIPASGGSYILQQTAEGALHLTPQLYRIFAALLQTGRDGIAPRQLIAQLPNIKNSVSYPFLKALANGQLYTSKEGKLVPVVNDFLLKLKPGKIEKEEPNGLKFGVTYKVTVPEAGGQLMLEEVATPPGPPSPPRRRPAGKAPSAKRVGNILIHDDGHPILTPKMLAILQAVGAAGEASVGEIVHKGQVAKTTVYVYHACLCDAGLMVLGEDQKYRLNMEAGFYIRKGRFPKDKIPPEGMEFDTLYWVRDLCGRGKPRPAPEAAEASAGALVPREPTLPVAPEAPATELPPIRTPEELRSEIANVVSRFIKGQIMVIGEAVGLGIQDGVSAAGAEIRAITSKAIAGRPADSEAQVGE